MINNKLMKNRKAQGLPVTTLVLLIIGGVVLVSVIIGFTTGWGYIFGKLGFLPDDLTTATAACKSYAGTEAFKISYCQYRELRIEGKKRWVNCDHVHSFAEKVLGVGKVGYEKQSCSLSTIDFCKQLKAGEGFKESTIVNLQTCAQQGVTKTGTASTTTTAGRGGSADTATGTALTSSVSSGSGAVEVELSNEALQFSSEKLGGNK